MQDQDAKDTHPEHQVATKITDLDGDKKPSKKVPVFFLDEAHKLPALIQSDEA